MARRKRSAVVPRKALVAGSRVFAYCRDSGGMRQEKSVRDQVAEIRAYCQQRGWIVVRWFLDEASPGGEVDGRDAFAELIGECSQKPAPVGAVVLWSMARFGRGDELDSQYYKSVVRRLGIEIVSVTDEIPSGPMGPLIEHIIDLQNHMFLEKLSIEVKRGLRSNAIKGYAHGGRPPLGYVRQPEVIDQHRDGSQRIASRWVPDPMTAPAVRQAFILFAQGASYIEIEHATGLRRPESAWAAMFRSCTYAGTLKCGDLEIPDAIEPLCDPDTWARVQERTMQRSRVRSSPDSVFLLSGMVECGYCGKIVAGGTDYRPARRPPGSPGYGKPWRHYRCNARDTCPGQARISAKLVERRVIQVVLAEILTLENARSLMDEVQAMLAEPRLDQELADLAGQIAATKRALDNVMDMIEQGALTAEDAGERMRKRKAELSGYEVRRVALETRRHLATMIITDAQLGEVVDRLRADLQSEDMTKARAVLRAFVSKVVLKGEEFRVEYSPDLLIQGFIGVPPRMTVANPCIIAFLRPVST